MADPWRYLASIVSRHAPLILAGAAALTALFAVGASRLEFKTSQDTLLSRSSRVYQDNLRYQESFGGEPVLVLIDGNVLDLFKAGNRDALLALQRDLDADPRVDTVVSPLTAVEIGVVQAQRQQAEAVAELARLQDEAGAAARLTAAGAPPEALQAAVDAARADALTKFLGARAGDLARFQAIGDVSASNPRFAEFVLLDEKGSVRPEVRDLVPDPGHALFVIRLKGNMPFDEQSDAAAFVRDRALALRLDGLSVLATGPALLLKEINDSMRSNMIVMGGVSALVMAGVLFLVFRARWRLLSLPVVLATSAWLFGFLGFVSLPLTLVTISALPILIGLGVDFTIQIHNRFDEEGADGKADALARTFNRTGMALAIAVMAAVAGFLALQLSEVPMVRDFSLMLALGAVLLLFGALLLQGAGLSVRDRRAGGSGEVRAALPVDRVIETVARKTVGRAVPIVAIGAALLLVGIWADQRLTLQTDPERFISSNSKVLRDLHRIREISGSSDEIGFLVEAPDVRDPVVQRWLLDAQDRALDRHPQLVSGSSAASLVRDVLGRPPRTSEEAADVLATAPPDLRRSLMSDDGAKAALVFSVGRVSLDERRSLVNAMTADQSPPPGVTVAPGGLAVIGVATVDALGDKRTLMSVVAVAAIFVVLAVAYRSLALSAAALMPVLFALGSSATLLYVLGIELNPLTAVSGPLVIAMGTEFTVLLLSRYREERAAGQDPREALAMASERIGRAILASGLTVIGGFGALIFADFPLLQDFGKVTALNISLSLASALVILPPILIWLDEEVGLAPLRREAKA